MKEFRLCLIVTAWLCICGANALPTSLCNTSMAGIGPSLIITTLTLPIWETNLTFRELPVYTSHDLQSLKSQHPEYVNVTTLNTTASPWPYIPQRPVYLCLNAFGGYRNPKAITDLSGGLLGKYFSTLTFLGLSQLGLTGIINTMFQGLTRLKVLSINDDLLTSVPANVFQFLPYLAWVNLNNSPVKTISAQHFCYTPGLTFLQLSNTGLTAISGLPPVKHCIYPAMNSADLSNNFLSNIGPTTFTNISVYGSLSLANNSITTISQGAFSKSPFLLDLDLSNNNLQAIYSASLSDVERYLQRLSLTNNRLKTISPTNSFAKLTSLVSLSLDQNGITAINDSFKALIQLAELNLAHNKIRKLFTDIFPASLRHLELRNNLIEAIPSTAFPRGSSLQYLNIAANNLQNVSNTPFLNLVHLEVLNISMNNIKHIEGTSFSGSTRLKILELNFNRIFSVDKLVDFPASLAYFDISHNRLKVFPKLCCSGAIACSNLTTIKASDNFITYIDVTCFHHVTFINMTNNRIADITLFSSLVSLKQLFLRKNNIHRIDGPIISNCKGELEILDLGQNKIEAIDEGAFCDELKELYLDGNSLKVFDSEQIMKLSVLTLSNNPLECSCSNKHLVRKLKTQVHLKHDLVRCANNETLILVVDADYCDLIYEITIPVAVAFVIAVIIAIIVYRFRYEIQVIAFYRWHIRLRCCSGKKRDKTPRAVYTYDAFVCFATEDSHFVKDVLVPLLEPNYRLCIYYRDFPLGEDIAESILSVIEKSARVIIVLSENFLESRWGTFEFRRAHHHVMQTENKKLIIILMDEKILKQKLDLTLRSIMYSKAYLQVGDRLFNEKLFHSMPDIEEPVEDIDEDRCMSQNIQVDIHETEDENDSTENNEYASGEEENLLS